MENLERLARELVEGAEVRLDDFDTPQDYANYLVDWWLGETGPGRDEPLPSWWQAGHRPTLVALTMIAALALRNSVMHDGTTYTLARQN